MSRFFSLAVALFLTSPLALAHEGHDHGADSPPPPATAALAPRTSTAGERLEAVIVLSGTQLLVYLDNYASNTPVADAAVDVIVGNREARATQRAPGEYVVETTALGITPGEPGRHALTLVVATANDADLLAATLDVAATPAAQAKVRIAGTLAWFAVPVLLLLGGGWWWWRQRSMASRRIR